MATLHGDGLIIMVDGVAVAASDTCTVDIDAELIEVAPQSEGEYREYIVGKLSWKVSTGQLVSEVSPAMLLDVGKEVTLGMTFRSDETLTGNGNAIVSRCQVQAGWSSLAKGAFEFVGSGYLNQRLRNLFLGTVEHEYVATASGQKLRIRWS